MKKLLTEWRQFLKEVDYEASELAAQIGASILPSIRQQVNQQVNATLTSNIDARTAGVSAAVCRDAEGRMEERCAGRSA